MPRRLPSAVAFALFTSACAWDAAPPAPAPPVVTDLPTAEVGVEFASGCAALFDQAGEMIAVGSLCTPAERDAARAAFASHKAARTLAAEAPPGLTATGPLALEGAGQRGPP